MKTLSKTPSLLIVLAVYVIAFWVGFLVFRLLPFRSIWTYLCADAAATVIVWAFGLLYRNASMYDPYWSVAPLVLFICFLTDASLFDAADALFIFVFTFWGSRLTMNWIIGWQGMHQQDWRYTMLYEKNKAMWPLTNFFGINMIPTLFVFAGMVPAYYSAFSSGSISFLTVVGVLICIAAVLLQIVSDGQMRRFRLNPDNSGKNMVSGLWKYSRHPNYLGEVSFWWGIFVMMLGQLPSLWWLFAAPLLMTLLFVFISIPMMEEKLLATRPGYVSYKRITSMLLLLPQKKVLFSTDSNEDTAAP